MEKKKYTIKDIAKLAGVSKGTVDRVLHKRGKVSQKSFEKVDAILKEIDYKPNPIARSLKNNKIYSINVLLPDPKIDAYWSPAHDGILTAASEFGSFGVNVKEYFYHPDSESSFVAKAKEVLKDKPDGVLMAPYFQKESLKILEQCQEEGIVLASFNNVIDGLHNENFIGQNLFQSGKVAASLLDKMLANASDVGIVHINQEPHMKQKENGFKEYFKDKKNTDFNIKTFSFTTTDDSNFEEQAIQFFKDENKLSALFVTNSKAHLVVSILKKINKNVIVVGYDLIDENVTYLKNHSIDFLIHQKPNRQAYLGVLHLAEFFLFGKKIPTQKILPIDIVTSENYQYYLN